MGLLLLERYRCKEEERYYEEKISGTYFDRNDGVWTGRLRGGGETAENEGTDSTEESGSDGDGYTIGCVIINDANTHCIAFAEKFQEIVESNGDEAIVLAANDDSETLLQCIDDLMAAGVDGIVMESPNATAPVEALREAADQGVVIAAADVLLDIDESEGVLVSQTVSDNYNAGVLCAEDFIERLDGAEGTVCHMVYEENEAVTTRVQGFLDTIAEHDNITVLEGTQPTPVTQEAEMALAESWAAKYDEISCVFGGGGPIAIAFMRRSGSGRCGLRTRRRNFGLWRGRLSG